MTCSSGEIEGHVVLDTFENSFNVLSGCLKIKGVRFHNIWYKDWSWFPEESHCSLFAEIDDALNDDCIREVFKYLDILHLVYLSRMNQRFKALAAEQLSRCHIFPSTTGTIGILNFRYLLETFGNFIKELHLSFHAFAYGSGFFFHRKVLYLKLFSFVKVS